MFKNASEVYEKDCALFMYMHVKACIARGNYDAMLHRKDLKLDVLKLLAILGPEYYRKGW